MGVLSDNRRNEYQDNGGGPSLLLVLVAVIFLIVVGASLVSMLSEGSPGSGIQVRIPVDDVAMPSPPQCNGEDCKYDWDVEAEVDENNCINWIRVLLNRDGCPVAENQMAKIDAGKYEETADLVDAGHDSGWISSIEVDETVRGQGLGRTVWRGGDQILKLVEKSPVHIFADIAGWGESLMQEIEHTLILIEEEGLWAYLVK
jgi:hypothetical protein